MTRINKNFLKLPGEYLFPEIARRVRAFQAEGGAEEPLIRLGIGDVTEPLGQAVTRAMAQAARELSHRESFRGYCEEPGGAYGFLRRAIIEDYRRGGVELEEGEVFLSDGAKSDCGGIGDIFGENTVAVCDPGYPVYVDVTAMAGLAGEFDGRRWTGITYLPCTPENGFFPTPPEGPPPGLIWLCNPVNPTGAAAGRERLRDWVEYARSGDAVLLYDGAYEAFITTPGVPHSIFELPGARECAIELRSFSKSAGFTGVRCAYMVIPTQLEREGVSLNALWRRRQGSKFNGVSYVTQRGAQAALSPEGRRQSRAAIALYRRNAQVLRGGLEKAGLRVWGGVDAPYLWVKTPEELDSWSFFDFLLRRAGVVTTPGAGFGPGGEGYIRLTAFGREEDMARAAQRIARACQGE